MEYTRFRRILILFLWMIIFLTIGFGYFFVRTGSLTDAFWLNVTVISTLGMADTNLFTPMDKIVSSFLVLISIILFMFLFANVSEFIISGQLRDMFGKKKMKDKIEKLQDHFIVCGYGRIGKSIVEGLKTEKKPFIVIENAHELIDELASDEEILFVEGDASHDDALKEAGIEKAKGIFCALGDDADNILTVLNARALNLDIQIVTRISSQDLETRFLRAGANQCVSPQSWGSRSMLMTMFNPTISEMLAQFLDKTIEAGTFYEIIVPTKSKCDGKTLGESGIRQATNVNVIGIRKHSDQSMKVNPQASSVIESGDTLICLGGPEDFLKLKSHLQV